MKFLPGATRHAALAIVILSLALTLTASAAQLPNQGQANSAFTSTCILTGTTITPDACLFNSFPLMAIGIIISFMIIAIVYMAGNVMNYKPLKDWYRKELWESIKTIILVCVILSVLVILSGITDMLVGANYVAPLQQGNQNALSTNLASLYNADNVYVGQQLELSYQAYSAMLGLATGLGILKSLQLYLWFPIPLVTPTIPPIPFGSVQFGSQEYLYRSNFISATQTEASGYSFTQSITGVVIIPMLILFQFQSSFFYYLMALGLGVLIPLGIIFRAFPLCRDVGGTLIATGIGIAIVYPSLLLLLNMPVTNYIYTFTAAQTASNSCPFGSGYICKAWNAVTTFISGANLGTAAKVAASPVTNFVKFPVLIALGSTAAGNANVIGALTSGYYTGLTTPLTSGILPSLNFILAESLGMILQFILVAIDLLVGLLITGAVTQVLGGKVKLGIGSKLSIRT